ncbi:MAG: hypothetical protein ACI9UO_001600 [Nitrospinales bacterium]|jgi:hypothetical protein
MACGSAETGFGSLSDQCDIDSGSKTVSCVSDCGYVASAVWVILPVKIAGQPQSFKVGSRMDIVCALFELAVVRKCNRSQQTNYSYYNQYFDEGETALV